MNNSKKKVDNGGIQTADLTDSYQRLLPFYYAAPQYINNLGIIISEMKGYQKASPK